MNDDTISRQAAIEALEEPCKVPDTWTDEFAVGERSQWEKDVKALNSLPSAQPEWAQKVEEYRKNAPQHIHNPLAWALYQVWKEYDR